MALGHERDKELAAAFRNLREIKADVVYPLLLELYTDYQHEVLSREDLISIVGVVTSYIFRRVVCRVPTNSLNRTFSTFTKAIDKERYVPSVQAHFLGLKSYRAFPMDKQFIDELTSGNMYNFQRRSYLLRRLENFARKEPVSIEDYTIEDHPNLSRPTPRALFEKFRGEVLALDEAVSETFLKNYVAYKTETNFVDVIPQTERLKLTLNIPFEALHDERGLALDVTGKGRWGNGNVQVDLDEQSDLNHIMGLVRQAYEYQVGA